MNNVQRALLGLFGFDSEQPSETAMRLRNMEGATAEESAALGAACLEEGEYEAAIQHFRTSVEQRSKEDIKGRMDLGGAFEAAGRPAEALRQYRVAARTAEAPEPHLGAAQIYKQHAKYNESIDELKKAIEIEPRNAFIRFKLAELLRQLKMFEEATVAAVEAAAAAPTESFYHYWVADLLIELGRFEDALGPMKVALDLSPGDDFLYYRASAAFWGSGRHKEAIRAIRLASELDPDKPLYHGVLAAFLRSEGMNQEAELEEKSAEKMDSYDLEELKRLQIQVGA